MKKAILLLVVVLAAAACGDDSDLIGTIADQAGGETAPADSTTSTATATSDAAAAETTTATVTEAPDPCTLAGDTVLTAYFGTASVDGERGQAGPIQSCSFRDANANSLLVQVATGHPLFRPDPCDGCLDLPFGDDGFAAPSLLQSTATVVDGDLWLSVSTTGFGDDGPAIIDLLETVHGNATG